MGVFFAGEFVFKMALEWPVNRVVGMGSQVTEEQVAFVHTR